MRGGVLSNGTDAVPQDAGVLPDDASLKDDPSIEEGSGNLSVDEADAGIQNSDDLMGRTAGGAQQNDDPSDGTESDTAEEAIMESAVGDRSETGNDAAYGIAETDDTSGDEDPDESGTWAGLQELIDQCDYGGTITLEQDYLAGPNDASLRVQDLGDVTIDLNGHTIDRGLGESDAVDDGCVFYVEGFLTLTGSGTITGGNNLGNGGGIYMAPGSGLTLESGVVITGNKAKNGAGVYIATSNASSVTIEGAEIIGNTASNTGGGVYAGGNIWSLAMKSGSISGNSANTASAVHVGGHSCFEMTGGSITGNSAVNGPAVNLNNNSSFEISGAPVIKDNTSGGKPYNVYVREKSNISVMGDLENGAEIGVSTSAAPVDGTPVTFAYFISGNGNMSAFFSDDSDYQVVKTEDGDAALTVRPAPTAWQELQEALSEGGNITLSKSYTADIGATALEIPAGVNVTLDLNGNTIDRGLGDREAQEGGFVIINNGTLTIRDTGEGGCITGGNNSGDGGGIFNNGTMILEGGCITGNKAGLCGGGINNAGTLTMTGGSISNNIAVGWHGGGIYNYGTLTLSGGSIEGNEAQGAKEGSGQGGGILQNGTMNVSGSPVVKDNTALQGDNIYLRADHQTMSVTGAFTKGASLYVTTARGTGVITSGYGTYNSGNASDQFFADSGYSILTVDGETKIVDSNSIAGYWECSWADNTVSSVYKETDAIPVPDDGAMTSGWYYLNSNVTVNGRILLTGNTNLILGDGYTLDVKGLYIPKGSTLTVYGQTAGTGKIYSHPSGGAGIGGYDGHDNGHIIIHGGTIEATGYDNCAGIGSNSNRTTGNITIYGGTITAGSRNNGAGIGAGRNSDGGTITIYGGSITATGADSSAGIGGGDASGSYADNSTIYIYGGTVTATGNSKGAGIGGGEYGHAAITISGGTVNATGGGSGGAGIGNGVDGDGSSITINGGVINATGGSGGYGIGKGKNGTTSTIALGYSDMTQDTVSITANSYYGDVTLSKDFKCISSGEMFLHGQYMDTANLAGKTLVAADNSPVLTIKGVTGSFNDKIKLNFYFLLPETVLSDQGAYVSITNGVKTITLPVKDAEYYAGKGYRFSIPLAAKEAGDTITARAFDGEGRALTIRGTLRGDYTESGVQSSLMVYFTWLKNSEQTTAAEKAVGAAAQDYCAAAQLYFGYHVTEDLAVSSAVTELDAAALDGYKAGRGGTLPAGVGIKGISAMLESDNTLRLYYDLGNVDPNGLSFTIDGNKATLIQRNDGMHYIALGEGVYSNHLQDTYDYVVSDGTDTYTITASVLTYARSCALKNNEKESNLGKALYLYNRAAVAAFGE